MGRKVTFFARPRVEGYCYEFPRPALTVDCVVLGFDGEGLAVLLIRRARPPFAGTWALPGGFVDPDEPLDAAARRELEEETDLRGIAVEQLAAFGDPGRDPRGHTVSVAYLALVDLAAARPRANSDAAQAAWFPLASLPPLAFDHDRIIERARLRLRDRIRCTADAFALLPEAFTLSQMQRLFEHVLERPFDKRNFRKKVLEAGYVGETGQIQQAVSHRAARLYRFDRERFAQLAAHGLTLLV